MSKYIKLLERLNYQNIYMINKLRQLVMRSVPRVKLTFFAKQKGRCEFSIHFTSNLAIETLRIGSESICQVLYPGEGLIMEGVSGSINESLSDICTDKT